MSPQEAPPTTNRSANIATDDDGREGECDDDVIVTATMIGARTIMTMTVIASLVFGAHSVNPSFKSQCSCVECSSTGFARPGAPGQSLEGLLLPIHRKHFFSVPGTA